MGSPVQAQLQELFILRIRLTYQQRAAGQINTIRGREGSSRVLIADGRLAVPALVMLLCCCCCCCCSAIRPVVIGPPNCDGAWSWTSRERTFGQFCHAGVLLSFVTGHLQPAGSVS